MKTTQLTILAAAVMLAPAAQASYDPATDPIDPIQIVEDGALAAILVPTGAGAILDWVHTIDEPVQRFRIYRQLEGESYEKIVQLQGDATNFTDDTADPNEYYLYVVVAIVQDADPGLDYVRSPELPRPPSCKPVSILLTPPPPGASLDPGCIRSSLKP